MDQHLQRKPDQQVRRVPLAGGLRAASNRRYRSKTKKAETRRVPFTLGVLSCLSALLVVACGGGSFGSPQADLSGYVDKAAFSASDAVACVTAYGVRRDAYRWAVGNLPSAPDDDGPASVQAWAEQHPDLAERVCVENGWDIIQWDNAASSLARAEALRLFEEAVGPIEVKQWNDIAGLDDEQVDWCSNNWDRVFDAALTLDISPFEMPEVTMWIKIEIRPAGIVKTYQPPALLADVTSFQQLWLNRHEDWARRSCEAAFELR